MTDHVPDTVACPCGTGYAKRRPEAIRERVSLDRVQLTHVYRHDGCAIGGHIVTVSGYLERKAGPLFGASPREIERLCGASAAPRLAADGGEPT